MSTHVTRDATGDKSRKRIPMASDTANDKTSDTTHDATDDSPAFGVTITEVARLLGQSVRTVQRALDYGKTEAVAVAGKRCVRLRANEVLPGLRPDESAIIDGGAGFGST